MRQRGFTVIEVLLFLSLSSLLFLIAMGTLTASINNTRFTDATNSLDAFLAQQYSDIRSGVSYRDSSAKACTTAGIAQDPGAADNCIVVGRLLELKASGGDFGTAIDTINSYTIVARRCPDIAQPTENGCPASAGVSCTRADGTPAGRLGSYCPRVITNVYTNQYTLDWGAHLPRTISVAGASQPNPAMKRSNGTVEGFNRLAIIHSPTSERIYTYAYTDNSSLGGTIINIPSSYLSGANADREVLMCLKSPDFMTGYHFVSIGAGQGSDLINSGEANANMPGTMRCQ